MTKPRSFAPFIAAVLLLLPVLYVGSYFALVVPEGRLIWRSHPAPIVGVVTYHYRLDIGVAAHLFQPLEQIDRRLRPGAWERGKIGLEKQASGSMILKSGPD